MSSKRRRHRLRHHSKQIQLHLITRARLESPERSRREHNPEVRLLAHERASLLALFWPESDHTHARGALRNALSFLRHQLGETVIVTRGDEVGLDPATFWSDVTAFVACADAQAVGDDAGADARI